jgi:hypothetical protein
MLAMGIMTVCPTATMSDQGPRRTAHWAKEEKT